MLKICHLVLIKLLLSLLIEIFKLKPNVCNIHSWSICRSTFRDQTRERLNLRPGELVHKVKNEMNKEQQLSSLHSCFNVKGFKHVNRKSFYFSCSGRFFLSMLFYFKHKHVAIMQCLSQGLPWKGGGSWCNGHMRPEFVVCRVFCVTSSKSSFPRALSIYV